MYFFSSSSFSDCNSAKLYQNQKIMLWQWHKLLSYVKWFMRDPYCFFSKSLAHIYLLFSCFSNHGCKSCFICGEAYMYVCSTILIPFFPNCWSSIYNGNRTEWSPIWSVIIWVINKIGRPRSGSPICLSQVWLQPELDDTMSCYQLIKTMTKFEKRTKHWLSAERF